MPQFGQALWVALGQVTIVTKSGVGRTCTTDRPAGISGNKRRDKGGDQGSIDVRLIWGLRAWSCIPLHQNRGRAPDRRAIVLEPLDCRAAVRCPQAHRWPGAMQQ